MNRLALGTAQFGLNYGIANKDGKVNTSSANAMLQLLLLNGIDMLDTAIAYGTSESCLGAVGVENFKLVTKLPAIPDTYISIKDWIFEQVDTSLTRLKINKLYGLLLHRPEQLLTQHGPGIYKTLLDLKEAGKVQNIGVSIYNPDELNELVAKYKLDLIQAPFNLVDCRLYHTGWLQRLKDIGIEVHCRSVFLQGLLLIAKNKIPTKFIQWTELWEQWSDWLFHSNVSAVRACLMFPLSFSEIDRIVVGADNIKQLEEIISTVKINKSIEFPDLACNDEKLINPRCWPALVG